MPVPDSGKEMGMLERGAKKSCGMLDSFIDCEVLCHVLRRIAVEQRELASSAQLNRPGVNILQSVLSIFWIAERQLNKCFFRETALKKGQEFRSWRSGGGIGHGKRERR